MDNKLLNFLSQKESEKLLSLLERIQLKSRERTLSTLDIFYFLERVEKRLSFLPKKLWEGVTAQVSGAERLPNAYKWKAQATVVRLCYKRGWRIAEVKRGSYYGGSPIKDQLLFPSKNEGEITSRLLKNFRSL
jgi:hypothetical protein